MNINGIHHIAIICSDYEQSKHFYVNILGCKIIRETFREERQSYKLDLEVGIQGQLELFSFPNPPPRMSRPESCGLRHFAFHVEDLHEAVKALKTQNVPCEPTRIDEFTGKHFTFFSDPDGLPLELYQT